MLSDVFNPRHRYSRGLEQCPPQVLTNRSSNEDKPGDLTADQPVDSASQEWRGQWQQSIWKAAGMADGGLPAVAVPRLQSFRRPTLANAEQGSTAADSKELQPPASPQLRDTRSEEESPLKSPSQHGSALPSPRKGAPSGHNTARLDGTGGALAEGTPRCSAAAEAAETVPWAVVGMTGHLTHGQREVPVSCLSTLHSVILSVCLSVCHSLCLSVCLSVCLAGWLAGWLAGGLAQKQRATHRQVD